MNLCLTHFFLQSDLLCLLINFGRGDPIPSKLIEKIDEYIPPDFVKLLNINEVSSKLNISSQHQFFHWTCLNTFGFLSTSIWFQNSSSGACKPCSWIHTDIMDDNIYMEPSLVCSTSSANTEDASRVDNGFFSDHDEVKSWCPSYILDFSDISIGQCFSFPICSKNFYLTSIMLIFISKVLYLNVVMIWYHNLSSAFNKFLVIRTVGLVFSLKKE